MLSTSQLQHQIEQALPCEHVAVQGDGHHFYAEIVSSAFEGLGLLARHRLVKDKLKAMLDSGELHALSLSKTKTPAEWAAGK